MTLEELKVSHNEFYDVERVCMKWTDNYDIVDIGSDTKTPKKL